MDFTDLNQAYPKDNFPLPQIDRLVNSTARHKLLTLWTHSQGTTDPNVRRRS